MPHHGVAGAFFCDEVDLPVPLPVRERNRDGRPLLSLPLSTATFTQWYEVMKVVGLHEWSVQEKCKAKSTLHALTDNRSSRGQAFAAESTRGENEARAAREGIGSTTSSLLFFFFFLHLCRPWHYNLHRPTCSLHFFLLLIGRPWQCNLLRPTCSFPSSQRTPAPCSSGRSNTSNVFTDAVAQATQHVLSRPGGAERAQWSRWWTEGETERRKEGEKGE